MEGERGGLLIRKDIHDKCLSKAFESNILLSQRVISVQSRNMKISCRNLYEAKVEQTPTVVPLPYLVIQSAKHFCSNASPNLTKNTSVFQSFFQN